MSATGKAVRYPRSFGTPWRDGLPGLPVVVGLTGEIGELVRQPGEAVAASFEVQRTGYTAPSCLVSWRVEGTVTADYFAGGVLPEGIASFGPTATSVPVTFLLSPGPPPPTLLTGRVVLFDPEGCRLAEGHNELVFSIAAGVITTGAVVSLDVPFTVLDPEGTPPTTPEPVTGPPYFSPAAAWNRPVGPLATANATDNQGLDSATLVSRLLTDGANTYIKCMFDTYTFPFFIASASTPRVPLTVSNPPGSNIASGTLVPWDAAWVPSGGYWNGSGNLDSQATILDPATGEEWDLWRVRMVSGVLTCTHAHKGVESYHTGSGILPDTRSIGVQYLAMTVLAEELQAGPINHALAVAIPNEHTTMFYPPAIHTDGDVAGTPTGVPAGTRFQLLLTDAERDAHVAAYPAGVPAAMRTVARNLIDTLRTYGFLITDNAGAQHFYFEDRNSGEPTYAAIGMSAITIGGVPYPNRLLDDLFSTSRLRAIVPSDKYP